MKNNRFAQHKKEIDRISREQKVDIGVAVSMLAQEMGWQDWGDESMEFCKFVNDLEPEARAAYFAE